MHLTTRTLVPDELWNLTAPLLPSFTARPQGGGTAPCDEHAVFTAVVYVLTSGCAWRYLPPTFGTPRRLAPVGRRRAVGQGGWGVYWGLCCTPVRRSRYRDQILGREGAVYGSGLSASRVHATRRRSPRRSSVPGAGDSADADAGSPVSCRLGHRTAAPTGRRLHR
ncbi:transposase [Streptomyces rimosus]|uniref:transposase n=1 Tax=Streptomyces rimosus TaxID=1927 RepID=UPI003CD0040C